MTNAPINFEDVKWGTFKRQFTAYRKQHPKSRITTLGEFANDILVHPHHYQERTVKRARFYTNVLARKLCGGSASQPEAPKTEQPGIQLVQVGEQDGELGGRLAVHEIKDLIDSSYEPQRTDLTDFDYDPELSSDRAKVYKRKNSNQAVVVHRGTQGLSDMALDLRYSLGQDITNSDRFRHAKNIQERAEKKYGRFHS